LVDNFPQLDWRTVKTISDNGMENWAAPVAAASAGGFQAEEARQMGNFGREVNQHFADGYGMIYVGRFYAIHAALMEKRGNSPVEERLLVAGKDEELEQKLRESAAESFCIIHAESTLVDSSHGDRYAYLEKCEAPPEYTFTMNDQKARADFDKAVAEGYRIVPSGIFGKTITLIKAPAGNRYDYWFAKDSLEADEAKKKGYAELPLSFPIWRSFVLEKKVSAAHEAQQ
jgi:hypothetical protein